jgi:hypothetical protein
VSGSAARLIVFCDHFFTSPIPLAICCMSCAHEGWFLGKSVANMFKQTLMVVRLVEPRSTIATKCG